MPKNKPYAVSGSPVKKKKKANEFAKRHMMAQMSLKGAHKTAMQKHK